ncbi:FAD-binding protein [Prosthecodimorpha staleyi]|uniref:FAD-binding protein n=1 Tax=Prosthecodimorpha staleyi TaxID=2840188 RepID=A0A947GCM5_9HYPH|nr:FAD-binding protein [Prosthecodimorpha staleyi]MBT9289356.1 FAD-binding protein [Prosthecodimorpha staleyi]
MAETYAPRDADETRTFLAWALAEEKPVEVIGHGSKRPIGRPVQAELTLDLSGLSGLSLYEPEELVLSAQAGTPVAEIEAAVAARGQELAFEPMDYGPVLGLPAGRGTIGGLLATNLAGPRRLSKGAARDHVLGIKAVSGRGEAFKAGGRVVKNVTGYDLARGLSGSWGTLAALTEVTFKVLPRAEASETIVLSGLDDHRAVAALAAAMGSSTEVSGAAHLPADAAVATGAATGGTVGRDGRAATLVRLEGVPVSIAHRADMLMGLLAPFGRIERIAGAPSEALWRAVRDVAAFTPDRAPGTVLWRVSVAPSAGPVVAAAVARAVPDSRAFYDWQGGLVWLCLPATPRGTDAAPSGTAADAGAATIRAAVAAAGGGHATLIRADAATRAAVPVFEPQPAPLAALGARLKAQFDPKGILNPGRMA